VLLYYMAFVFMGKGVRELQEGDVVPISVIRGLPSIEALGFYPTWQTVLAQMLLLGLFVFLVAKTFWPKRSVTLPTINAPVPTPAPPPAPTATEVAGLREEIDTLNARIASLEEALRTRVSESTEHFDRSR
jgi:hypothetical protein